jgi:serine/threonine protein phosphatase PrpC
MRSPKPDVTVSTKTQPDGSHQFQPVSLNLEAAAATHVGLVRETNEDVWGIFPEQRLFVVADGMGGRAAGEVAARLAIDALEAFCNEHRASPPTQWPFPYDERFSRPVNLLRVGLKVANQRVRDAARSEPAWFRMGATIAALTIDEDNLVAAHAGDVRVYRFRRGNVSRLTRDHSVAEEIKLARAPLSPQDLAAFRNRNIITRALGNKPELEPTVYLNSYTNGDLYLLCTDGLWSCVDEEAIARIVGEHGDVETACHALVDAANAAGGPDNISVLLVRVQR